jgi:hypothetical protein
MKWFPKATELKKNWESFLNTFWSSFWKPVPVAIVDFGSPFMTALEPIGFELENTSNF